MVGSGWPRIFVKNFTIYAVGSPEDTVLQTVMHVFPMLITPQHAPLTEGP
jgi:hypothetical protein